MLSEHSKTQKTTHYSIDIKFLEKAKLLSHNRSVAASSWGWRGEINCSHRGTVGSDNIQRVCFCNVNGSTHSPRTFSLVTGPQFLKAKPGLNTGALLQNP